MQASTIQLAAYTGSTRDRGTWWVVADKLCQRWNNWLGGKSYCFTLRQQGESGAVDPRRRPERRGHHQALGPPRAAVRPEPKQPLQRCASKLAGRILSRGTAVGAIHDARKGWAAARSTWRLLAIAARPRSATRAVACCGGAFRASIPIRYSRASWPATRRRASATSSWRGRSPTRPATCATRRSCRPSSAIRRAMPCRSPTSRRASSASSGCSIRRRSSAGSSRWPACRASRSAFGRPSTTEASRPRGRSAPTTCASPAASIRCA